MSQNSEGNIKTFTSGEALAAFRRVKLDGSGNVVYSDSGEDWIGTTEEAVAISTSVSVRLRTAAGTRKVTAAGAFSINAHLYGADDGMVDDAVAGLPIMRALEAATALNDIIEAIKVEGVNIAGGSFIWVSPDGDNSGDGSLVSPLLTITAALALCSATRKKIMVMPGEYAEADIVWPNVDGIELIGVLGSVMITQSTKAATAVVTIAPTSTSTFSATLTNIEIESDFTAGTCLSIANSGISTNKKMIISLNNIALSTKAVTDKSLIIVNSVSSGAIRVYAMGSYQIWEGLVDFTTANTGDRLRIYNHKIVGTLTMNEAVVSELTLIGVGITADPTVDTATLQTQINCWHEDDADPDTYTAHANAYSA